MPIKDKTMSLIRIRTSLGHDLISFFNDIFYRDKSGLLANAALKFYEKLQKENSIPSSKWRECIFEIFGVPPIQLGESNALKEMCEKYANFLACKDSKKGLRGKKPYQILLEKHSSGEANFNEKEIALLERVSKWYSALSSYYSIVNKLKALGIIEKKEGNYTLSNKFVEKLREIEKLLIRKA